MENENPSPQPVPSSFLLLSVVYEIILGLPAAAVPPLKVLILQSENDSTEFVAGHLHVIIRSVHDSDYLNCILKVDHVVCSFKRMEHIHIFKLKQNYVEERKRIHFSYSTDAYTMLEEMLNK